MSFYEIKAKPTLTAFEMNKGEALHFILFDGSKVIIELLDTGAEITSTTLKTPGVEEPEGRTTYHFRAVFKINGRTKILRREVPTRKSFYEPELISGVSIWLDAVDDIFSFMNETHGPCRPNKNCSHNLPERRSARIAIQDASAGICPEKIFPWCPLPPEGLDIKDCFRGEDCWLGCFDGASAHGGLDINHPRGTPLYAPFGVDCHFLYNSIESGHNNNRWRAIRGWDDGSHWIIESSHMISLTKEQNTPLSPGSQYAIGAGVYVGNIPHTHFAFSVFERGELIRLDPWILFRQMYIDS